MARNKFQLEFKGFEELSKRLEELGGDLRETTEKALQNTHDYIMPKLHSDMKKHHRTGNTEGTIIDEAKVVWTGDIASVDVGFNIAQGGLASIFLMYGTPRHKPNHPGTTADKQLYNDIYGRKTRKEVAELPEKTCSRAISKRLGG